jgi:protein SCO1
MYHCDLRRLGRALAAALGLLVWCAFAGPGLAQTPGHGQAPVGVDLKPLFELTTHHGKRLAREDLRGRPFILAFGYLNCPEVCPTTLFELSLHLQELGRDGDRVRVLFLTVDPERDTVANLKSYLESFDGRIIGLTGSAAEVSAVTAAFSAPAKKGESTADGYSVDHPYSMLMVDRYGMLSGAIGFNEPDALRTFSQRLLRQ